MGGDGQAASVAPISGTVPSVTTDVAAANGEERLAGVDPAERVEAVGALRGRVSGGEVGGEGGPGGAGEERDGVVGDVAGEPGGECLGLGELVGVVPAAVPVGVVGGSDLGGVFQLELDSHVTIWLPGSDDGEGASILVGGDGLADRVKAELVGVAVDPLGEPLEGFGAAGQPSPADPAVPSCAKGADDVVGSGLSWLSQPYRMSSSGDGGSNKRIHSFSLTSGI